MQRCEICGLSVRSERIRQIDSGEWACFDCLPAFEKKENHGSSHSGANPAIDNQKRKKKPLVKAKSYAGLLIVSKVYLLLGLVGIAAPIIFLIIANDLLDEIDYVWLFVAIGSGIQCFAIGCLFLCLRDMAIWNFNSMNTLDQLLKKIEHDKTV